MLQHITMQFPLYCVVKIADRNAYQFVDQLSPLDHVAETDLQLLLEGHEESWKDQVFCILWEESSIR
jgi:hypothetical protein